MSSTKSLAMQVVAFMLAVATLAVPLFSQTFYGSIVGTVTDASGAVIQGARATLTNNGTAERRSATTDASGNYRFFNLVPGNYSVGVEQPGFVRYTRDQIPVTVEAAVRVDVSMQLGEVTQSLEVTSQAPLLQTENASVGQVVAGRSVEELPLNGRNVLNLVDSAWCSGTGRCGREYNRKERVRSRKLPDWRGHGESERHLPRRSPAHYHVRQHGCIYAQPGCRS